jgi:lysine decarboxylase
MPIEQTLGEVCAEFVMSYPPGIPIFAPGEVITQDALNYVEYAREKGCFLTGAEDMTIKNLKVIKK